MDKGAARLDVLDGLRGIAILLVLWFHYWQMSWLQAHLTVFGRFVNLDFIPAQGAFGVELFLFLSGFCLFHSYARKRGGAVEVQPLATYAYRRAIKIVPSYLLAIALILVVFGNPFRGVRDLLWHLGAHLVFLHNLFPETAGSINGVFWSLGVEVQFYLVFPMVAWAFIRGPLATFVAFAAAAYGYRAWVGAAHREALAYWVNQLPGFLDYFVGGMLSAHLVRTLRERSARYDRLWPLFVAIGFAGLVGFFLLLRSCYHHAAGREDWQIHYRSVLVLTLMAAAIGGSYARGAWRWLFANPLLVFLSTISYNLYIWHQFLAARMLEWRIPAPATADPHDDQLWKWLFFVSATAVSVAFSAALTYGFERPLLRNGVLHCARAIRDRLAPSRMAQGPALAELPVDEEPP